MTLTTTLWACALLASATYTPHNQHRVQPGESFATISKLYNTGYLRLLEANPGVEERKLRPGMVVTIPARIREEKPTAAKKPGTYVVQNGDTDWSIARRHGIKPSDLRALNNGVDWRSLQIGAVINVPVKPVAVAQAKAKPTPAAKPASVASHRVRPSENDWIIARRYGIAPSALRSMNPGVDWSRLQIGTLLKVPALGQPSGGGSIARLTTKRARVIRNNVVVRAGGSTSARKIGKVSADRIARVADRIGDWYKLKFDGGTVGWVRGDLLAPVTATEAARIARRTGTRVRSERYVARNEAPRRPATASTRRSETRVASTRRSPRPPVSPMDPGVASSLIGTAMNQMGIRYRWGGTSRGGFDCSGFTTYVFRKHGKSLPRTSAAQSRVGAPVAKGELKQGDLVFFKTRSSRVSHVGIYMGDGKFVHASSGSGRVRINSLSDSYYAKRYAGARRVKGAQSVTVPEPNEPKPKAAPGRQEPEPRQKAAAPKPAKPKQEEGPTLPVEDPAPAIVPGSDVVGR